MKEFFNNQISAVYFSMKIGINSTISNIQDHTQRMLPQYVLKSYFSECFTN